jgi:tight adherence protein B
MDRSLPFSFLDHKVKCGNGLVGAWFDQFLHYPVMAWKNREGGDKGHSNGVHFPKEARGKALREFATSDLKSDLADPVGDRVVEVLRTAREVGGSDVGLVLRTLAAFLREENRTRAELAARQSWTVNGARLAVASPWLVLLMLGTRPDAAAAYRQPTGVLVIAVGAAISALAYVAMLRLGRLPDEPRVLS